MIQGLSKTAFWDVNFEEIDPEKNATFIIEKVFNYGLWNDQLAIIKYYGHERMRKEVVKGASYKKKVLSFLCTIFNLQPADFKCYIRRQSHPQHWNY